MNGIRRTIDLGLGILALRTALVAGRLTPLGVVLLLPSAVALAREGAALAREGAEYLRTRRARRRFILRVR